MITPKPLDQIKGPDRADHCNGEGYQSPTETAALRNVFREEYRAPERPRRDTSPQSPTRYASVHPPAPRVNAASTVQLEQELARRKAEERRKAMTEAEKARGEALKRARQFYLIVQTLCKFANMDFVGMPSIQDKTSGFVFTPVDCQPNYKG